MKELLSIGEVAKLKGLTIKALRYYEKIGLLRPYYINPDTNYRYYHIDQLLQIEFISLFKKAGVDVSKLVGILSSDDPKKIAQFARIHAEIALKRIKDLENSILLFKELNDKISSDRKLPSRTEVYMKRLNKRYIISAQLEKSPLDYDVFDKYFEVYNLIRKKNFLTVFATGTIITIDLESLDLKYKSMYVEVLPINLCSHDCIEEIPGGHYLCINYFQDNKEIQLRKIVSSLERLNLKPKLTLQVDTFYDVVNYKNKNTLMELQCLFDESSISHEHLEVLLQQMSTDINE